MKILPQAKSIRLAILISFSCSFFFNVYGKTIFDAKTENASDSFDIKKESFLLPQVLPSGHYTSAIYLDNIFIPPDWTLDVIKAPVFCYSGKYTLPKGFNVQATIATLIVSYRGSIGPFWHYSIGNDHFGIGYQLVYNYGTLNQKGYSTTITGWETQPSIAYGHSFKTIAFTVRGDLYLNHSFYVREGDNVIPYTTGFLNGYSVTTSLEQRLSKDHVLSVGFKLSYLRYHFAVWPAFPVNAYYYYVPEVQLGYNF